jgi:hypothetical protein
MTTLNNKPESSRELTLNEIEEGSNKVVQQGLAGLYQLGWFYNYVVERNLAQQGGFKDAQDFFAQRVKAVSQSALSMYGAIARSFTATACVAYGVTRLSMLLTYEKFASIEADGNEPGPTPIQVPQKDGSVKVKPFAECTAEELKLAVKAKRNPLKPLNEDAKARLETYRDAVERHFTRQSSIRVSARVERGKVFISLRDIPEEKMSTLIKALRESLKPLRAVE